jgi:hypothetical protein
VEHLADLDVVRGDGLGVDEEAACTVSVRHDDQPSRLGTGGAPRDQSDKVRVGGLEDEGRLARGLIHRKRAERPLISALHADDRAVAVPVGGRQVLERVAVPLDLGTGSVLVEDEERHVGVLHAGHGIEDLPRWSARRRGVRDPPPIDRRVVHPGDQEAGAVR